MSLNKTLLEQLFLIEVLVHKVNLRSLKHCESECKCKHAKAQNQPLRVRVKFINFPCIEVNQEEFGKKDEELKSAGNFSSGKSFLFPMAPLDLIRAIHHFPLAITVIRKGKASAPPDILGVTEVQFTEEMCDTIRRTCFCDEELPICSKIKDTFDLVDLDGEYVGYIVLFVRLSCFGQSIITKFQLMDKRSYLFKNTRPDEPYNCDVCDDNMDEDPQTYDIVPVTPMVCTSDTVLDQPCCKEARILGDIQNLPVQWEMLNMYDSKTDNEEHNNAFLRKASDKHVNQSGGEIFCSCAEQPTVRKPSHVDSLYVKNSAISSKHEEQQEIGKQSSLPVEDAIDNCVCPQKTPSLEFPPLFESKLEHNPPVRYDTTSSLSPAYGGRSGPRFPLPDCCTEDRPPVRYDTTGALSPAFADHIPEELRPHTSGIAVHNAPFIQSQIVTEVKLANSQKSSSYTTQRSGFNEPKVVKTAKNNVRRFKPSKKYVYTWGTRYPGVKFGHKACVEPSVRVPSRKGWLWDNNKCVYGIKPRKGWRPGAIGPSLSNVIKAAPQAVAPLYKPLPEDLKQATLQASLKKRKEASLKPTSGPPFASMLVDMEEEEQHPPVPTLHIHRCGGDYYVSMHPPVLSGDSDNIPLQFKILGKKRKNQEGEDDESLSTSSSELEIELFSPGAFEPRKPQTQLVHHETQYYEADVPPSDLLTNDQPCELQVNMSTPETNKKKEKKGTKTDLEVGKGTPARKTNDSVKKVLKNDQPSELEGNKSTPENNMKKEKQDNKTDLEKCLKYVEVTALVLEVGKGTPVRKTNDSVKKVLKNDQPSELEGNKATPENNMKKEKQGNKTDSEKRSKDVEVTAPELEVGKGTPVRKTNDSVKKVLKNDQPSELEGNKSTPKNSTKKEKQDNKTDSEKHSKDVEVTAQELEVGKDTPVRKTNDSVKKVLKNDQPSELEGNKSTPKNSTKKEKQDNKTDSEKHSKDAEVTAQELEVGKGTPVRKTNDSVKKVLKNDQPSELEGNKSTPKNSTKKEKQDNKTDSEKHSKDAEVTAQELEVGKGTPAPKTNASVKRVKPDSPNTMVSEQTTGDKVAAMDKVRKRLF